MIDLLKVYNYNITGFLSGMCIFSNAIQCARLTPCAFPPWDIFNGGLLVMDIWHIYKK